MANEERIRGLEDAVILLSNIDQARFGAYAVDQCRAVPRYGAQIRKWIGQINARRAINPGQFRTCPWFDSPTSCNGVRRRERDCQVTSAA
jgi:hypothetical protein